MIVSIGKNQELFTRREGVYSPNPHVNRTEEEIEELLTHAGIDILIAGY